MTRIAVFADVHGNMPALEAVLADIAEQRVDEVLVGGDLVGRGPEGSKVVERIAALGWPCVRGNHEDYMLDFRYRRVPEEWWRLPEWSAARWMAAELGEEHAAFIDSLPLSLTSAAEPDLRVVHGSPKSTREGLGTWSSESGLRSHLDALDEDLLVCAHTHRPMVREVAGGLVVNVGAVGLPFNRDRRAQYAIFERNGQGTGVDGWQVTLRQVDYDVAEILDIYDRSGFLAAGGVTTELLRLELEHARAFLVPFVDWVEAEGLRPDAAALARFREGVGV
jgi:putative phosphoesterase